MIKCLRLFIFVVLFIVACGQTPAEATATPTLLPEPILVAEATLTQVVPTAEPTAEPTPTATAKPTAEPTLTATPVAAPEAVVAWLQTNAVAFDTEQPGSGCDDLQPLLAMIGEARIVALGEATHGTSEFFKMKHRIVECLIVEKGFNLFLIEDYWIEANQINQYVQTGEGDARQLLQGLGNIIWHTEEILHLIQWLQQYNESNDTLSPLAFRGFDMSQVHNVLTALLDYVDETDPESLPFVESEMQCYRENYLNHNFVQGPLRLTETQFQRCREGVQNVHEWLLSQQAAFKAATGMKDYSEAVYKARLLVQNEHFRSETDEGFAVREASMADNIIWLLEEAGPETRAIIWAHNGHVQTQSVPIQFYTEDGPSEAFATFIPMGYHLREYYGHEMVVVGFTFQQGAFNARRISNGQIGPFSRQEVMPAVPGSYEPYLTLPGLPRYILDLRPVLVDEQVADWFGETRWLRAIGWGYDRDNVAATTQPIILPEAFDIIIYFENSTPSNWFR